MRRGETGRWPAPQKEAGKNEGPAPFFVRNPAEFLSFGSTAHGAGRLMSRNEALRRFRGEQIRDELIQRGIELKSTNWRGVAEEASAAYKDVEEVVRVSDEVGLGRLVAKLVPIGVMKG